MGNRIVSRLDWADTLEALQSRVAALKEARAAHALTEGVPAPRDEFLVESLADFDGEFELAPLPLPPEPPKVYTQAELEAMGRERLDSDKLFKAKLISDLAFRLGKAPGTLTVAELTAERDRIAAIFKVL